VPFFGAQSDWAVTLRKVSLDSLTLDLIFRISFSLSCPLRTMARHHSECCDCERCHPSEEASKFLVKSKTKKLSPETLYSRRKQQERRVAEELRALSTQDFASTPQRVTRSRSSAIVTVSVSPETLIVVQNIVRRYKEKHGFSHIWKSRLCFSGTYTKL
jgi:hypothetical protein